MLYLIGLGLNVDGISKYGLSIAKMCKKLYLETYTVDFPYSHEELEEIIGKKIIPVDRDFIENLEIIDEASKMDVALLVYGSPLTATTHITLIQEAKKSGVRYKITYNASILDAVAETGLQLYKFGKIASVPNFEADSFMEIIRENQKINAHSLILIDIGMELKDALGKISKIEGIKLGKIVVCSRLGTQNSKIYYDRIENLKDKNIKSPFCIIIPGKLHFIEGEILEEFFKR